MLIVKNRVHCFECNKNYFSEIMLDTLYEGSISCPEGHLIGNQNDEEWKELIGVKDD